MPISVLFCRWSFLAPGLCSLLPPRGCSGGYHYNCPTGPSGGSQDVSNLPLQLFWRRVKEALTLSVLLWALLGSLLLSFEQLTTCALVSLPYHTYQPIYSFVGELEKGLVIQSVFSSTEKQQVPRETPGLLFPPLCLWHNNGRNSSTDLIEFLEVFNKLICGRCLEQCLVCIGT